MSTLIVNSMKKPITASEMGKRGGRARADRLSKERIREISRLGGIAARENAKKRKEQEGQL